MNKCEHRYTETFCDECSDLSVLHDRIAELTARAEQAEKDRSETTDLLAEEIRENDFLRRELFAEKAARERAEREVVRLREALIGLSRMYTRVWDSVDGSLVMMPEGIAEFEEAHRNARVTLGPEFTLLGDLPGDDDELRAALEG